MWYLFFNVITVFRERQLLLQIIATLNNYVGLNYLNNLLPYQLNLRISKIRIYYIYGIMRSYKKYSIPFILIISYKTIFLIPPTLGTCRHLDLEHVVSYFLSYYFLYCIMLYCVIDRCIYYFRVILCVVWLQTMSYFNIHDLQYCFDCVFNVFYVAI